MGDSNSNSNSRLQTALRRVRPIMAGLALALAAAAWAGPLEEKMQQSTVRPLCVDKDKNIGIGSGFVIGDGGYVATNWHVVDCVAEQGGGVAVFLALDNVINASVVWHSAESDLAVLRLERNSQRPPVVFASRETVEMRDAVTAAGFPGAADDEVDNEAASSVTLTTGVVSRIVSQAGVAMYQFDASINPGNSGGPLFNEYGEVIGVNAQKALTLVPTMRVGDDGRPVFDKLDRVPLGEGIGLAIQADELFATLDKLHIPYSKSSHRAGYLEQQWRREPLLLVGVAVTLGLSVLATGIALYSHLPVRPQPARTQGNPSPSRRPLLRGVQGHYAGAVLELPAGALLIGRDPKQCQLVMPPAGQTSKRHCSLSYDPRHQLFQLQDCGSTNGTYRGNGQRLTPGEPAFLAPGERFYLGDPGELFEVGWQ